MAINLATKYSSKIAEKFTKESYVKGNTSNEYDFIGVRSINIYTPVTVPLGNYDRTATANRFGTPVEMQDTVQEMTLTQEPSFSITIDKGNNLDQENTKGAMQMLGAQLREQVIPFMDKYAFASWVKKAGKIAGLSAAPTKSTIVSAIFDGAAALDEAACPDEDRILYIPTKYYNMLRLSSEFLAADSLAAKSLEKGVVGSIADMKAVKVHDCYFPENVYFLITYKKSVMLPNKIKTARVLTDVAGIDGAVLEGRNYFDAFVIGSRAGGVYAAVASSKICADPAISAAGAITCTTDNATLVYTTDGSDPRYSKSAKEGAAADVTTKGTVVKAYAYTDALYPSGVVSKTL